MNPLAPLPLTVAFAVACVILIVICALRRSGAAVTLACVFAIATVAAATILGVGASHGAFQTTAPTDMDIVSFANSIRRSPTDSNQGASPGRLVILYRFGCADCEATYADARRAFGDGVVWTSSRSETGADLVETYNVGSVPTAIYFRRDTEGNQSDAIVRPIAKTDANGENPTFDAEGAEIILEAWEGKI